MTPSSAKAHTACRVCAAPLSAPYLDLGAQPLANALTREPSKTSESYPLAVALCPDCGLSQLTVVVDPTVLYADYGFRSGTTAAWATHCAALADSFVTPGLVLDIAANDGTQLKAFKDRGWVTVGVEPAEMATVTPGVMYREFFSADLAQRIRDEQGTPHLIVAQNVLGHVDDPVGFLRAAASLLHPEGHIVVEVPSVHELMKAVAFDTIYHEHVSYWSTGPLIEAASRAGLLLDRVDTLDVHGGSRRYWLRHANGERTQPIFDVAPNEEPYREFARTVQDRLTATTNALAAIQRDGKRLWAFGASAKGTVMLNALKAHGNTVWPEMILDDAPTKHGRYTPGINIKVNPSMTLRALIPPDVIWLLSWNWAPALMARCRAMGFTGDFLVTTPTVEIRS